MNSDVFEGRWKQMRGDLKSWWGKLTDDDFEKIAGKRDRLLGMLQEPRESFLLSLTAQLALELPCTEIGLIS